jgi:hypothetical protein
MGFPVQRDSVTLGVGFQAVDGNAEIPGDVFWRVAVINQLNDFFDPLSAG